MPTFQPKSKPIGFILIVSFYLMTIIFVGGLFYISQNAFSRYSDDVLRSQTDEISRQIVYNYENFTDSIIKTSNIFQEKLINKEPVNDKIELENFFYQSTILNESLINVSLYDLNGNRLLKALDDDNNINQSLSDWFIGAINDPTTYYYSKPKESNNTLTINISKYVPIDHYTNYAVINMELNFGQLIELALKSNLGLFGHITIINNEYDVIYSSKLDNSISLSEEIKLFQETILGNTQTTINSEVMMFVVETITSTPWRIGVFINIQNSLNVRINFITSLVLFLITFTIIWSIVYIYISKKITNPLVTLEKRMRKIESKNDFSLEPIAITFPREAEVLSHSFEVMMKRIDSLLKAVINEKNEQRKSELRALQNQINPHFLYNTLDSIVWMVEDNRNEEAAKMIIALSRLFKISISGGENIIGVREELEHAKNYLYIQSIRFKDKFKYEIIVEDDRVLEQNTLKLILQPMIENAIYHGIDKTNNNGIISIKAGIDDNYIRLSIEDNGYGLSNEKIKSLYEKMENNDLSDGVGIKNVYQRLKVYYGKTASLIITSNLDQGTKIEIRIPLEGIK